MRRWQDVLLADRFYHRAFSRLSGVFTDLGTASLAEVGKEQAPHKALATSAVQPARRKVSRSGMVGDKHAAVVDGQHQGREH